MGNKENFKNLVSKETTDTAERNQARIRSRAMLQESQQIAMKVLDALESLGWTQKRLAGELGVTPQQVSKIVSGRENLTLATIVKLQQVLGVGVLAGSMGDVKELKNTQLRETKQNVEVIYFFPTRAPAYKESNVQYSQVLNMGYAIPASTFNY